MLREKFRAEIEGGCSRFEAADIAREDVRHAFPNVRGGIDARVARAFDENDRIVEQQLFGTGMYFQRRQAAEIPVQW